MESMRNAIRAGMEPSTPAKKAPVPTAADIMTRDLVTFRPDDDVRTAMALLLRHRISGGPVVGDRRQLVGTLSEGDCLRAVSAGAYDGQPMNVGRLVKDLMNCEPLTIAPSTDIYAITQTFVQNDVRRLPVIEAGIVVGQVSRRDVLRVISAL